MIIPFICVNYHSKGETVKYIENVLSLSSADKAKVIIVDNSKSEDDFLYLQNYIKEKQTASRVDLIRVEENKGYFHGLNVGIAHAQQVGVSNSFYVIGNNDILFKQDFIVKLQSLHLSDDTLVISPDVVTKEDSHENPHVVHKMSAIRKIKYDVYFSHYIIAKLLGKFKSTERRFKELDPNKKFIYMGIGALYILTPKFFYYFDSLWDKVFLYGEEAVFAGQIRSVSGKILYDPSLVCYHNESATTSQMETKFKYNVVRTSYKTYRKYL
ncbi:glycosyltransferase family 2 protein [Pedobacter frigiditerrae]|uniref:glycosyltransferase family 2 protein n=1 Tax=Pedobacter frigiditerrae TaxID=2530452 RepID=UPI0029310A61|nr:glycosyltransferase [Pedobacter frigiditerrae]